MTNYIWVQGPLDYVLHFASPASPIDYLEKPIQTLKVGSLGTHKTLGLAKDKNGVWRGMATKNGTTGHVSVDYQGHVIAN